MARKWSARKQVIFPWTHGGESRSETSILGISGKAQLQLQATALAYAGPIQGHPCKRSDVQQAAWPEIQA